MVEDARDLGELIGNTEDGGGVGSPSGARNLFIRDQSVVGTLNSVLKPNLVNTVLGQYARRHYNFPGATGEPDLSVVNDLEFGHNFGTYDAIYESRVQGSDSVAWVKGNHVAKFGFDGNYVWSYNNYPGFTPERVLLPDLDCMYAFADAISLLTTGTYGTVPGAADCPLPPAADGVSFLYWGVAVPRTGFVNGYVPSPATGGGFGSGWPNAFPTNQYSNYAYTLNHGYWGIFAEDQWRVTHNLTLNYGLRWDVETGLGNTINRTTAPSNRDWVRLFARRQNGHSRRLWNVFRSQQPDILLHHWKPEGASGIFLQSSRRRPQLRRQRIFSRSGGSNDPKQTRPPAAGNYPRSQAIPGTPSLPCARLSVYPRAICNTAPGGTISVAALTALGILGDGPQAYPPVTLTGPCTANAVTGALSGACGVGAGGIQRDARLPYAYQASFEIDREVGRGLSLQLGYLFVGAHKLVRGNNINVPCPYGTAKPSNPYYAQGLLDPSGSLTACSGTPILGPLGLGPFFDWLGPASPIPPAFAPPNPLASRESLRAGIRRAVRRCSAPP